MASVETSQLPPAETALPSAHGGESGLVDQVRRRSRLRLERRDEAVALALATSLVATSLALVVLLPDGRPFRLSGLILVLAYAIASRIEFEVGTVSALPTQLVLVPMLLALPVQTVPLCVASGLVLGRVPDLVRGSFKVDRVPLQVASAWHAVGPALVLTAAGDPSPSWHRWPLYLGALGAQVAFDVASSLPWVWLSFGIRPLAHLRGTVLIFAVDAALAPIGLSLGLRAASTPFAILLVMPLIGLLAYFARERQVRIDHTLELSHAYRGTALLLGDVIEADDAYTGSHSRDVVELVVAVAGRLGLDAADRREAELAALLHDVGKVRIPAEIINKPGPLDDDEWAVMRTHTIEGERMLEQVGGLLGRVGRIVRSCHERWDGAGYPDGLAGDSIPLAARIVCCCDAFNAMTTDRPYRRALPLEEVRTELLRCRGTHFDPAVVDALLSIAG